VGPLVAPVKETAHHAWTWAQLQGLPAPLATCEAAVGSLLPASASRRRRRAACRAYRPRRRRVSLSDFQDERDSALRLLQQADTPMSFLQTLAAYD
jgi:hypothetical protein